jgi:uncharacterized protein (DUF433 family)
VKEALPAWRKAMAEADIRKYPDVVYIPTSERNSLSPASWIEKTPGVCGGDARIRRMRIPVWLLVEMRQRGAPDEEFFLCYPSLTPADLAAAWEYHDRNKAEIADAIYRQDLAMRVGPELFDSEP